MADLKNGLRNADIKKIPSSQRIIAIENFTELCG